MSVSERDYLKVRRDRALGSIMGHLERKVFPNIPTQAQQAARQVVLDALNTYHDSVLDLVKADDGTTVRNEEVFRALGQLNSHLAHLARNLGHPSESVH